MATLFSGLIRKLKGPSDGELPIREQLYSAERLEQYAPTLAGQHKTAEKAKRANLLLPRLEENGRREFLRELVPPEMRPNWLRPD